MNRSEIFNALDIRYVDLKFSIAFMNDCHLPRYKTSALRGGMGQMLLRQNCVRDEKCEACDFEDECLVRRMMYAKYEIQPRFASHGDSMGYVIECDNKKERFRRGEVLEFHLLLYGKLIVHFSHILQAFYVLGQMGLGHDHAQYEIIKVENEQGEAVVKRNQVYLNRLGVRTIREYAEERMQAFEKEWCRNEVHFTTPTALKYDGELIKEFNPMAIFRSVLRRIYSFNCFEGMEIPLIELDEELPEIVRQEVQTEIVPRFSSTMGKRMNLKGISGIVVFDYLSENLLLVLLAGEKLHIGKNTSFGFGGYQIR